METDDFFNQAAKGIRDLINKRPWSPTLNESAQVIEEAWWQSPAILKRTSTDCSTPTRSASGSGVKCNQTLTWLRLPQCRSHNCFSPARAL